MSISVLVVDDSALIRSLLTELINDQSDMHCVGAAQNAYVAKDMVNQLSPDVITLDIEMPKVDGLTFLDKLMKARPTPVIMISTLTEQGTDATVRALELGAIDYIPKPKLDVAQGIEDYEILIADKIRLASTAKVKKNTQHKTTVRTTMPILGTEKIVAIGASTGGTEAIKRVLTALPANFPGTVITQHMPSGFTQSFAKRLNASCKMQVKEAEDNERVLPGHVYIAPGEKHMLVKRNGADYRIVIDDSPRMSGHKPSVDKMFNSLVTSAGKNAVAAILTGMGKDGAEGMRKLRELGSYTIAQDEASSVVYGMPKEAVKLDAVVDEVPLDDIANALIKYLSSKRTSTRL